MAAWEGWAFLELLGHRRVAGHLSEEQIAGAAFIRVDVPSEPPVTQFYAPGSVYGITPTTEEMVRRFCAKAVVQAPAARWELAPAVEATADVDEDDHEPWEAE